MLKLFGKFKKHIVLTLVSITLLAPLAMPSLSFAACDKLQSALGSGVSTATGSSANACGGATGSITNGISSIARTAVNIFSIVVGIIAVIMIIYGGFKYITSGGDTNNVSGAKNTLIYAIVGLFIVAIAQLIVHYVLNTASTVGP